MDLTEKMMINTPDNFELNIFEAPLKLDSSCSAQPIQLLKATSCENSSIPLTVNLLSSNFDPNVEAPYISKSEDLINFYTDSPYHLLEGIFENYDLSYTENHKKQLLFKQNHSEFEKNLENAENLKKNSYKTPYRLSIEKQSSINFPKKKGGLQIEKCNNINISDAVGKTLPTSFGELLDFFSEQNLSAKEDKALKNISMIETIKSTYQYETKIKDNTEANKFLESLSDLKISIIKYDSKDNPESMTEQTDLEDIVNKDLRFLEKINDDNDIEQAFQCKNADIIKELNDIDEEFKKIAEDEKAKDDEECSNSSELEEELEEQLKKIEEKDKDYEEEQKNIREHSVVYEDCIDEEILINMMLNQNVADDKFINDEIIDDKLIRRIEEISELLARENETKINEIIRKNNEKIFDCENCFNSLDKEKMIEEEEDKIELSNDIFPKNDADSLKNSSKTNSLVANPIKNKEDFIEPESIITTLNPNIPLDISTQQETIELPKSLLLRTSFEILQEMKIIIMPLTLTIETINEYFIISLPKVFIYIVEETINASLLTESEKIENNNELDKEPDIKNILADYYSDINNSLNKNLSIQIHKETEFTLNKCDPSQIILDTLSVEDSNAIINQIIDSIISNDSVEKITTELSETDLQMPTEQQVPMIQTIIEESIFELKLISSEISQNGIANSEFSVYTNHESIFELKPDSFYLENNKNSDEEYHNEIIHSYINQRNDLIVKSDSIHQQDNIEKIGLVMPLTNNALEDSQDVEESAFELLEPIQSNIESKEKTKNFFGRNKRRNYLDNLYQYDSEDEQDQCMDLRKKNCIIW